MARQILQETRRELESQTAEGSSPGAAAAFSCRQERLYRAGSRSLPIARLLVAIAAGVLISQALTSEASPAFTCVLLVIAAALPFLAGCVLKMRLSAGDRACTQPLCRVEADAVPNLSEELPEFLIVSSDLRICSAQRGRGQLAGWERLVGRPLDEIVPAEGLAAQAQALFKRSCQATSCTFACLPGEPRPERRTVSILMTRLPPTDGEDRILVVIEKQNFPSPSASVVEGYIC